ncbi:hypothetical protein SNEBB_004740 [Seison nebaliae]|nr:hypothetical protein SNEBB_004740 [Seison nebaliae]
MNSGKVLVNVNGIKAYISCHLCNGYLIDAVTIQECLHSFCKVCLFEYLEENELAEDIPCPMCKEPISHSNPIQHIVGDKTLQELVYKIVPNLYKNEMKRRREFEGESTEDDCTIEDYNISHYVYEQIDEQMMSFDEQNLFSVSIEYNNRGIEEFDDVKRFFVEPKYCRTFVGLSGLCQLKHLRYFVEEKFDLKNFAIEILYTNKELNENLRLMDVANIFGYRRLAPMRFFFRCNNKLTTPRDRKRVREQQLKLKLERQILLKKIKATENETSLNEENVENNVEENENTKESLEMNKVENMEIIERSPGTSSIADISDNESWFSDGSDAELESDESIDIGSFNDDFEKLIRFTNTTQQKELFSK